MSARAFAQTLDDSSCRQPRKGSGNRGGGQVTKVVMSPQPLAALFDPVADEAGDEV